MARALGCAGASIL